MINKERENEKKKLRSKGRREERVQTAKMIKKEKGKMKKLKSKARGEKKRAENGFLKRT